MAEYIEKNKAINAVFEAFADGRSAYIALEAIPAADVQPVRHGRWDEVQGEDELRDHFVCGRCGAIVYTATPYCGFCGAKMDGGEE